MSILRGNGQTAVIAWVAFALVPPSLQAADPNLGDLAQVDQLQRTLAAVAEAVSPCVVAIRAERQIPATSVDADGGEGLSNGRRHRERPQTIPTVGSGIIIGANGLILTNEHVIQEAPPESITCILSTGEVYTVRAITSDPRSDLAVLRIDARNLPEAILGDLSTVRQGHFAIVVGNPYGIASDDHGRPAMSFGIISALGRPLTRQLDPLDERYYGNLIQTDARINPGNSGGPLLNLRGEVIGITTAVSTRSGMSEGIGYAIPMDARIKDIITQLARGEPVEYGFLGVRLDAPTPEDRRIAGGPATGGALVRDVERGTPAAEARLHSGDLVMTFDGTEVQDIDELIRMVGAARVGVPVTLGFFREGRQETVQVTPARRSVPQGVNTEPPVIWAGMRLVDLTSLLREKYGLPADLEGVLVLSVDKTVLAGSAEPDEVPVIQAGRVIRQINDTPVGNIRQLRSLIETLTGTVKLTLHTGTEVEMSVPSSTRPSQ